MLGEPVSKTKTAVVTAQVIMTQVIDDITEWLGVSFFNNGMPSLSF